MRFAIQLRSSAAALLLVHGALQAQSPGLPAVYSFSKAPAAGLFPNEAGTGSAQPKGEPQGPGPGWKSELGGYLLFEGIDYLELPKTLGGQEQFSLSLWFRPDMDGYRMVLFGAVNKYNLEINYEKANDSSGRLRWAHRTRGWQKPVLSDGPPRPGVWQHVAITCDGETTQMYVDGLLQEQTGTGEGAISEEGGPELLGTYAPGQPGKWIGGLKDLRFFDKALGIDEVGALYASGKKILQGAAPSPVQQAATPSDAAPPWETAQGIDYLKLVRAYADTMIKNGRDVYGPKHSPLFAAALNREIFRIGSFTGIPGIRGSDRITTGANPMTDENLYQVLYALSKVTGDRKYQEEADKALTYFFQHAQSPTTGLLAWGEHMGWDFKTESAIRDTHEYFRPWVLWKDCYRLVPKNSLAFGQGVWDHQIHNQETGTFSRHGGWSQHDTRPDWDFPRHAGFYIDTWAQAYRQSKDPVFLQALETLVRRYDEKRAPESGAIPAGTSPRDREIMWPHSNLSLAIDLTQGAAGLPAPLATSMIRLAGTVDETFLKMKHSGGGDGEFFVTYADVHTLEAKPASKEWDSYARFWSTGYGKETAAQVANICALRHRQLIAGPAKEAYAKLILASADLYLESSPDLSKTIYPGTLGDVIWNLLNAHDLSGDPKYLDRAEQIAGLAAASFFKGGCALPTASSDSAHYEAVTRGDTLMMAFLRLWNARQERPAALSLVYTDR